MKISTKGRYALRLMLDLARQSFGNTDPFERCGKEDREFPKNIWNR